MIAGTQLEAIAAEMGAAQRDARQVEPYTSRIPGFDLDSAYAVAELLHRARVADGAAPVGRKLGFTNFDMWDAYGVREPAWAYVYDRTVGSLAGAGAACSLGRFAEPKIEPEIVFRMRSAPPPGADLSALLACVDWVAPAFEIVQSHFPGWKFRAADVVADWVLHGTLLLGEPVPVERLAPDPVMALESFSLALSCDGRVREAGKGSSVLGSPLAALGHLVAVLSGRAGWQPLGAGEIVTTGTVTTAQPVRPGERWSATLKGLALPEVSVSFTP